MKTKNITAVAILLILTGCAAYTPRPYAPLDLDAAVADQARKDAARAEARTRGTHSSEAARAASTPTDFVTPTAPTPTMGGHSH